MTRPDGTELATDHALRDLVTVALDALAEGVLKRGGPLPAGGPRAIRAPMPDQGVGPVDALVELTRFLAHGSADPADPACAAHLHCPPLAVAAVADLVASALNPSMDSWDQAPAASAIEEQLSHELARLCYPAADNPDAVVTTGGTESTLYGLLLARENIGRVQPVCGRNAHHSVARAAWVLGLPQPIQVDCAGDRMVPSALADVLATIDGPAAVIATAGTTNTGAIDPLPEIAALRPAWLHVDAAYGGGLLFSTRRPLLAGMDQADSIGLDLHKFGWQPIAAGVFAAKSARSLAALSVRADYLNAADDAEAGLPDLLGRSLRTSRRADAFKIAVTLRALGRDGVGAMVDHCCDTATTVADAIRAHPGLRIWGEPTLSTILLRPLVADQVETELGLEAGNAMVAAVRRDLLDNGTAVIGRATVAPSTLDGWDGRERLWLKLTLLHPHATAADYAPVLDLIAGGC
ncbi:Siderophore biosynthesis L-2,4-diaminobutyrate decarboxylase [Alloactinosynnema sp. L-07]|uniref:pyridoxal phosphate-dependent decarboxylase family protein n=1 Tax=Alloactinosynnema sp. L-07 TaxID=1653480 RepID=UPI00065F098C|nr:pyridoxal-dependent decarboxylase [Alloactinosynnema sp. L-07]CRK55945.1 Siderophore biosynthesis L-2,4-diaminobutyrate decarboxylase [Alloactinosynnema sp. L-07]